MSGTIDDKTFEFMVAFRRDIHRHPELSWLEHRTAERIGQALTGIGIPHRRLCGTGIVADLPGKWEGGRIGLRADIDALPIHEEIPSPFASEVPGVMHACGHDGHVAMLLGAATELVRLELPTPVRLIFQPAEEKAVGAKTMIEAGVLDEVRMIFGGHLDRHYRPGVLVVTEGAVNASADAFRIEISGRGGHAGRPHEAVDAVVVGSLMVMAIQTIVSREVNPASPAVCSVGRFDAGTVGNAIAARAVLEGTIRTHDEETRSKFKSAIRRIAESTGQLHGARVEVEFEAGTPVVCNADGATALARAAAARVVGPAELTRMTKADMGGEDFAYYLQEIPGCYVRVGALVEGIQGFPAHSSRFDFDESALRIGAAWMVEVALEAGHALANGSAPPPRARGTGARVA